VLLNLKEVLLMGQSQTGKNRFTVNIVLISIFSALWIALNLTVAPISFRLTGLPIIHSVIIFFILLLVTWATSQFGAASFVGIIGSAIALLAGGPLPILGFVPASIVFDLLFLVNHHKVNLKPINVAIAVLISIVCAYVAAVANGFFILNFAPVFTLTIWAGLYVLGGIIGVILALPLIGALERAQVKRVRAE
jgi:hypothetical protein